MADGRIRVLGRLVALLVVGGMLAGGVLLDIYGRGETEKSSTVGDTRLPDRVDLDVSLRRVDPSSGELTLTVLPAPVGAPAEDEGELTPKDDLDIYTSSRHTGVLHYQAGAPISLREISFDLTGGTVTDYPLDHYSPYIEFSAETGGHQVPVTMEFTNHDQDFRSTLRPAKIQSGITGALVRLSRSPGTLILAALMMASAWGLALAVLGAATLVVGQRRGLVWGALGWMAATLFALVGFRNTAPGAPPIGVFMDYAAFFWSELIIAVSVVYVAWCGVRVERRGPGAGRT
ncbi:putative membrane protein CrgA [Streptomyces sp. NBRC 110611]|nr:putative membrane protein CrgA [Streptomyces sp. NBRC 110611]